MRVFIGLMTLLLLGSAVFYIAGLDYDRPLPQYSPSTTQNGWLNPAAVFHPDSYDYVGRPYSMLLRHALNPDFFHNPSLTIYANMALFLLSRSTTLYHSPYDPLGRHPPGDQLNCESGQPPYVQCLREIAPYSLYAMARFLSALLVVLNVALVYSAGRLAFNRQVGLVAAVLAAFAPLALQQAHYDTPGAMTFAMTSAALLLAVVIFKRKSSQLLLYLAAGLLVGLAMAARYNGVIVGVMTIAAMGFAWRQHRRLTAPVLGLIAMPLGFVIGTPGAVFASQKFVTDVEYILYWYNVLGGSPGFTAPTGGQALIHNLYYFVLFVVGPIAIVAAVIGIYALARQRKQPGGSLPFLIGYVLIFYLLVYAVSSLSSRRFNANLLIPAIAPLALLAAYGTWWLWPRLWKNRASLMVGIVVMTAWPFYLSTRLAILFTTTDTRLQAEAWVYDHIPRGTQVYLVGSYNVPLDPADFPTTNAYLGVAPTNDPGWNSPILIYSDTSYFAATRDVTMNNDMDMVAQIEAAREQIQNHWIKLVDFPRMDWPGQYTPPDDVSYWHQMDITVYCNPANCPVPH